MVFIRKSSLWLPLFGLLLGSLASCASAGSDLSKSAGLAYNWASLRIGGGGFVSGIITSPDEEGLVYIRTDVGGAYRLDKTKNEWKALTDWVSEDETGFLGVESLAIDPNHPNRLYMLVGISYFNQGKTAILISDDYGDTFEKVLVTPQFSAHGNGMGRQNGERLAVNPFDSKVLFLGTRENGMFKSTDRGHTWAAVESFPQKKTPNGNGINFIVFDRYTSSKEKTRLYAGVSQTGDNLYRSDDGGETWQLLPNEADDMSADLSYCMPQRASLAPDGTLYISWANGAGPHASFSLENEAMDQGALFRYFPESGLMKDVSPTYRPLGGISVDPKNPLHLVCSTINTWDRQAGASGDRIFVSDDGGDSWTDIFDSWFERDLQGISWVQGHSIHWAGSIEFDPFNTNKVWVTSGNGLWSTENIHASAPKWKFDVKGLEETVPLDLVSLPGGPAVSVIGDYDGFVHEDPSVYAPIHQPQIGTETGIAFAALKPSVLVRVGGSDNGRNFPIYYSLDGAKNWKAFASKPENKTWYKGKVAVSADGSVVLWCPEKSSTVFRTDDWGKTWQAAKGLNLREALPVADPMNPQLFYAYSGNNGDFFVSRDGGLSFERSAKAGRGGSLLIRTVPGYEGQIWIPRKSAGLSISRDAGKTFSSLAGVEACAALGFGKAAPGALFPTVYIWGTIGGTSGIYRSVDEGKTWVRINDDAHQYGGPGNGQFILGDANIFGRVYMSTAGRGIIYGEERL